MVVVRGCVMQPRALMPPQVGPATYPSPTSRPATHSLPPFAATEPPPPFPAALPPQLTCRHRHTHPAPALRHFPGVALQHIGHAAHHALDLAASHAQLRQHREAGGTGAGGWEGPAPGCAPAGAAAERSTCKYKHNLLAGAVHHLILLVHPGQDVALQGGGQLQRPHRFQERLEDAAFVAQRLLAGGGGDLAPQLVRTCVCGGTGRGRGVAS